MRRTLALTVLALGACSSDSVDEDGTLAIVAPVAGEVFMRDDLDDRGTLSAAVPLDVDLADLTPERVVISIGDVELTDADAEGLATAFLPAAGTVTLTATAYDFEGSVLGSASVDVQVIEPMVSSCRDWLDLYRVQYSIGPTSPGVMDPVTAMMPINGIPFRSAGALRTKMFGDCSIIKSLAEAAPRWRARQIVEVTDMGVYNYRCIGNTGTPPNCPNGVSQHAYGNAIDLASFKDAAGTTYSVKTDWVIDPAPEKTCTAATEPGKDTWLHEMICELKAAKVWNIVLTPNFNADHRDHYHVDLSPGSSFID